MKKKVIFNSLVSIGNYQAFVDEIFTYVHLKIPCYVCFANVHMIIEAYRDKAFQKLINEANIVAPDGRPLSIFLSLAEGIKQDRVCGMDMLPELLKHAEKFGKSVYFYGNTRELLKIIVQKAKVEFPALRVAGSYSPPFRVLTWKEDEIITAKINAVKPDLVFVSLGCPTQERWIAEHKNKINACLLGLGQAFRVYAGKEKRLPKWMRSLSLEWVYRLCLEPRRLWKRYLYSNSYFLFLTVRHLTIRFIKDFNDRLSKPFRTA